VDVKDKNEVASWLGLYPLCTLCAVPSRLKNHLENSAIAYEHAMHPTRASPRAHGVAASGPSESTQVKMMIIRSVGMIGMGHALESVLDASS
jgi:hypothetical protein